MGVQKELLFGGENVWLTVPFLWVFSFFLETAFVKRNWHLIMEMLSFYLFIFPWDQLLCKFEKSFGTEFWFIAF